MKKVVYCVLTGTEEQFYFIDFANAEAKKEANPGSEIFSEEIEEEVFKAHAENGIFEDYEEPEIIKPEAETLPATVEKKTAAKVTKEQLLAELAKLQNENAVLKTQPKLPKKLTFEEAAEAYKRKATILNQIAIYEKTLFDVKGIEIENSRDNALESGNFTIAFKYGSNYNAKEVLNITNILVIKEMQQIAISKLNARIVELKDKVQEIDFV